MEQKKQLIDPDILKELKAQIVQELKSEEALRLEEEKQRREKQQADHATFIEKMKDSPDPWVEVIGWVETNKGVKVELEWNNAFVDYLRAEGIHGTDEEQVVQKWITLLLRDMADQMEERNGEFE